jgi:formylglycine-generating enzyme required for sulfatase activity
MAIDVQHEVARHPAVPTAAILAVLAAVGWLFAAYLLWAGQTERDAPARLQSLEATNRKLQQEASLRQQTEASFAERQQQAETAQRALDRLMADRTEVAQQLHDTQADLQLAQQTLARLNGELDERQAQVAAQRAEAAQFEQNDAAAKAALETVQAQVAERSAALAEATRRLDAARQEEAEARRNLAAMARDLEERRTEFAWFEEHGREARDSYAEAQQQLEAAQRRLGEAERQPPGPPASERALSELAPVGGDVPGEGTSAPAAAPVAAAPAVPGPSVAAAPAAVAPAAPVGPGGRVRDCETCPELVVIGAGSFEMGARNLGAAERPPHRVTLARPFALGRTEVTFAEWDACVAAGGCNGFRPDDHGWGRGGRPVIGVSWEDATAYARWLSEKTGRRYRLPSEAEWEYAARGGDRSLSAAAAGSAGSAFWWGDAPGRGRANCAGCGSPFDGKETAPADAFEASPLGLYNMHGNAAEWVADCWSPSYAGAPSDGAAVERPRCGERVLRGGAFNQDPSYAHAASRFKYDAAVRYYAHGFRVARDLP